MTEAIPNSRTDAAAAGWSEPGKQLPARGSWPDLMYDLPARKPLSWFDPRVLWACRNDKLAKISDPVPFERNRWVGRRTHDELTIDLQQKYPGNFSFLLMGDTGEGDNSQFAVAPVLEGHAGDAAFALICSDAQYPVGDVNGYLRTFYRPYARFHAPIYALPGNHDWYDDLAAFQYHFASQYESLPRASFQEDHAGTGHGWWRVAPRRWLWHRPPEPNPDEIASAKAWRAASSQRQEPKQPAPYYVIDAGPVRLVCIDTGILGDIDAQQADWLLEVSRDPRPKLLLTGKPLLVDGSIHHCNMQGDVRSAPDGTPVSTVLDVVHHAPFRYLGSIGGDIHNYQRYPISVDGRPYQHLVSGGGGAFMHATHLIKKIDDSQIGKKFLITEGDFKCYPLRLDSLAVYSKVLQDKLNDWHIRLPVQLSPAQAGAIVYPARDVARPKDRDVEDPKNVPRFKRFIGHQVLWVGGKRFHQFFSPFFDWDDPPFFRHLLRIDVAGTEAAGSMTVECYAVTGYREQELHTPVEDTVTMSWN